MGEINMAVYHVIIDQDTDIDQIMDLLHEQYNDYHQHHSVKNLVFLRTDDIAEKISNKLGISGPDEDGVGGENGGSVFKINAEYSGFTKPGIWQWMNKNG